MSANLRTAAQIRHDAVKADVLLLLDGLTENMKALFWRIYPLGLDHLTDEKLAAAHALVVRSVRKLKAVST